jgi:putative sigma-54 modulation protein
MLNLNISGHEVYLTDDIKEYATDKMNKLCKHYKSILQIDLILEENHNKTEDKAARARGNIDKQGTNISAEASAKTIYSAIDVLEQKLRKQLEKDKELHHANQNTRFAKSKNIVRRLFRQE